jgi:putative cardiolipin synthase
MKSLTGQYHRCRLAVLLLPLLVTCGCTSLPGNSDRIASTAFEDAGSTRLGSAAGQMSRSYPGQSGFLLLGNGLDALVARAALAALADRSLDVQYYLFHDDLVGGLLAYQLLQAADRGVRVRLLLDDMGLENRDGNIAILNSHPNIEIRIFNPFTRGVLRSIQFLTRFGSVTRRMHNKTFSADNSATIVGGRNIGNEYFDADPELAFGDLDVLSFGPVVREVSASFDEYWNSELSYPVDTLSREVAPDELEKLRPGWAGLMKKERDSAYVTALKESNFARSLEAGSLTLDWGRATVLADKPEKISSEVQEEGFYLAPQLIKYLEQTQKELIILSAYFVPGRSGVDFLKSLTSRGVRVRILTNSLASNDVTLVHAGYARYRRELLRAGVELYEVDKKLSRRQRKEKKEAGSSGKSSLHAKTFILDRKLMFISSFNFDPRSVMENTEVGILFHSPQLAEAGGKQFDGQIGTDAFKLELTTDDDGIELIHWVIDQDGKKLVYTNDPYTSVWRRFILFMAGWLPIESQL